MATVPLSGTDIRLLSNIPFSNDYKHTRWFDDKTTQTNWFGAKTPIHTLANANFQRIEGKNFISVNKSIDDLWGVNYLMFRNTSYNSKWFYAFVTKLEYVQKNTTYVHFQIDVFQTWKFDMNFKPSYVVREHCKLWNNDGSPVINTVDEGLNYGTEYDNVYVENYVPYDTTYFLVIVAKKTMHGGSADPSEIRPILNGSPQPLTYYVHPFKLSGLSPNVTVDGVSVDISPLTDVLKSLYTQTDSVNNIVSLYITDYIGYNMTYDEPTQTIGVSQSVLEHVTIQDDTQSFNTLYLKELSGYTVKIKNLGNKWNGFTIPEESKLLMYPYSQIVLDDFKGNRSTYKTEYINSTDLSIVTKGSLGTSNKTSYNLMGYNDNALSLDYQVGEEFALINSEANDIPIITDLLSAFIQGNRNSLQVQKNSIMFNGITGMIGNAVSGVGSALTRNPIGVASASVGVVQGAGNSVLQLQGMMAKQQDIANVPPNIVKMGSNTAYTMGNTYKGVYIIKKQIKPEYQKKLSDFFKLYGYKVNEVKQPNFHTRQNWNYVQTESCHITGNFNNDDLQELKSIFDSGITFWHTDDIGNYSLSNGVL